ncbi:MAG: FKBP-type peptidyl-prolyl cis-trans isomerase, partial [Clostridia bacterium]|nr:FKBP-type peptidyl-prolyl cis-trans isomerase [Clostridia bacterium]
MKRLLALSLALLTALAALTGCGAPEKDAATATATATADAPALSDEEAVADFLRRYRAGAFDGEKLYDYEELTAFFVPGPYKGLTYPYDEAYLRESVTDEDVEDYLHMILLNNVLTDSDFTRLTEGRVEKFDVAHIVYEGFIDGEALDNAASGDGGADLIIGSKSYIDGFETGLLGAAIGSEVTLDLHFSPYYGDEAVADRDVTFRVRVEHVQRPAFPELTVEKLNELFNASFADLDSVRTSLKADMDADQADRAYR